MKGCLLVLLLMGRGAEPTHGDERVIEIPHPPAGNSFETLWSTYRRSQAAGDAENATKLMKEIRVLRTERNVRSLEPLGLALTAEGLARLQSGDRSLAEDAFTTAVALDPHLPDAYLGVAQAQLKKGPLGIVPALRAVGSALTSRLQTEGGQSDLFALGIPVAMLGLFMTVCVVGTSLLIRHGTLLLHDLEEAFGSPRGRPLALAVYAVLLFLPTIAFQGYGWLPFWWLTLLFVYFSRVERIVAIVLVLSGLLVGPLTTWLESRVLAESNPIFEAALVAIEGGSDERALTILERATSKYPEDRDVAYLLGLQYKKAGRYEDAASLYRDILRAAPEDMIALNNLGNLEFTRKDRESLAAAIARYKSATETGHGPPEVVGTLYYNLYLAHLEKFEYQPAEEARSQAERLAESLVRSYDRLWKYDDGSYAVVDLSLREDQLIDKFAGTREGIPRANVAGTTDSGGGMRLSSLVSVDRFSGFVVLSALVVFGLSRWRGSKMFTMRCLKCGTPFCKHCHLGAAVAGLCTQCHHLFVVRDGVSGPARNQKLLEVQREDERRERTFRILSLLSPGAGHIYAHKTLGGVGLTAVWYLVVAAVILAGRVFPLTSAPGALTEEIGLGAAAVVLIATYVLANRARPDFEIALTGPRVGRSPRRS